MSESIKMSDRKQFSDLLSLNRNYQANREEVPASAKVAHPSRHKFVSEFNEVDGRIIRIPSRTKRNRVGRVPPGRHHAPLTCLTAPSSARGVMMRPHSPIASDINRGRVCGGAESVKVTS